MFSCFQLKKINIALEAEDKDKIDKCQYYSTLFYKMQILQLMCSYIAQIFNI